MTTTPASAIEALERIQGELKVLMPQLSKWRVEELRTQICQFHETRWVRKKFTKYGSLNKGFAESELKVFLEAVKEPRFKLLFEYQAYLGLRIGEVCKLNLADFDFKIKELRIRTEKAHTLDTLQVPQFLFEQTLEYIRAYQKEIESAKGYLFYKDKKLSRREEPYINLNYMGLVFRHYISMTGLNEVYGSTDETEPDRAKRTLHRLTTHSLRHYAITTFSRAVNGNIILTKAFARHREIGSTQVYIHTDKRELYDAIEIAFSKNYTKTLLQNQNITK